jgi:hypothetical protein
MFTFNNELLLLLIATWIRASIRAVQLIVDITIITQFLTRIITIHRIMPNNRTINKLSHP